MTCALFVTLGLAGTVVGLVYLFLVWNFGHWKKRGIKEQKPTAFYGSMPNMVTQKRNVCYDIQDIYKKFHQDEDFVGIYTIRTPHLLVLNPKVARRVLVTDFKNFHDNEAGTWFDKEADKILGQNPFILQGEEWKERRAEITPGLSPSRIKAVYPVTQQVCKKLVKYIKNLPPGVDVKDLSLRFTSEVVTDCVLGVKAESLSDNPTPVLSMSKKIFQQTTVFTLYAFLAGLWPTIRLFYQAKFFSKETETFFFDLMKSAFAMRRKNNMERMDFLNYMLQLQDKKQLSNEELASHTMTFLLDGFETSAGVITHVLYQLAKKPSVQEKLREEVLASLDEKDEIEFDRLQELPYLDQCIHESIRIIPPILKSSKLCTEPIEWTNKNGRKLRLNTSDVIHIPVYSFHHDEQFYSEPNEFIPERFDAANGGVKKFREMGVLSPFGDGPRICLGMKFALIQVKASLAEIIKNFNVRLNPKTRTDNYIDPTSFIGALQGGVWLDFEERN